MIELRESIQLKTGNIVYSSLFFMPALSSAS